jgi:hypothetical protein
VSGGLAQRRRNAAVASPDDPSDEIESGGHEMPAELLSASEIRGRLDGIVEPLREQLALVVAEIEQSEARLGELRQLRQELSRTIRGLTGEPAVNLNGKPRKVPGHKSKNVSDKRLDEIVDWLREHEADYPDGFIGTTLAQTAGFPGTSQTHVAKALRTLHAQGRVVFDHVGGPGSRGGAGKFYKLAPKPKPKPTTT